MIGFTFIDSKWLFLLVRNGWGIGNNDEDFGSDATDRWYISFRLSHTSHTVRDASSHDLLRLTISCQVATFHPCQGPAVVAPSWKCSSFRCPPEEFALFGRKVSITVTSWQRTISPAFSPPCDATASFPTHPLSISFSLSLFPSLFLSLSLSLSISLSLFLSPLSLFRFHPPPFSISLCLHQITFNMFFGSLQVNCSLIKLINQAVVSLLCYWSGADLFHWLRQLLSLQLKCWVTRKTSSKNSISKRNQVECSRCWSSAEISAAIRTVSSGRNTTRASANVLKHLQLINKNGSPLVAVEWL